MAVGGGGREVDRAVLRPRRRALRPVVQAVRIAPAAVRRVQEGHPLGDGDLELPDLVRIVDTAHHQAVGRSRRGVGAGPVDRVRERHDPDRRVARRTDLRGRHGDHLAPDTPRLAGPGHRGTRGRGEQHRHPTRGQGSPAEAGSDGDDVHGHSLSAVTDHPGEPTRRGPTVTTASDHTLEHSPLSAAEASRRQPEIVAVALHGRTARQIPARRWPAAAPPSAAIDSLVRVSIPPGGRGL